MHVTSLLLRAGASWFVHPKHGCWSDCWSADWHWSWTARVVSSGHVDLLYWVHSQVQILCTFCKVIHVTHFFYCLLCVLSHETASSSAYVVTINHQKIVWLDVIDDMIHCLSWVSTYAWLVWGLVPPNKISCTSTLTSSKSVQCGPLMPR